MGQFRVVPTLHPRAEGEVRRLEGLVDTGASYTVVPRPVLEALGGEPHRMQPVRFADGRVEHGPWRPSAGSRTSSSTSPQITLPPRPAPSKVSMSERRTSPLSPISDDAVLHVLAVGQAEMLLRRHLAEHRGPTGSAGRVCEHVVGAYPNGDGSFDAATLTRHSVLPYRGNMSEELAKRIDDLHKRFDDLRVDMNQRFVEVNQRFGELRADVNQRFGELREDVNQRFGELREDMNQRSNETNLRLNDMSLRLNDMNQKLATFMWIVSGWFTFLTAVLSVFGFLRR